MIKLEQIDSCVLVLAKNYFKTEYLSDYNLRWSLEPAEELRSSRGLILSNLFFQIKEANLRIPQVGVSSKQDSDIIRRLCHPLHHQSQLSHPLCRTGLTAL